MLSVRRGPVRRHTNPKRATGRRSALGLEPLETRTLLAADPLPVLMVLADHHFYYKEYADTRLSLEAADLQVVVASTTTDPTTPHANSGQGPGESGTVLPDLALSDVNANDYSAVVFVGGWGASMYQYAYNDPDGDGTTDNFYGNPSYNGDDDLADGVVAPHKVTVNNLISDILADDKVVAAICHGVSVLAWARVDGVSPLAGRQVAVPLTVGNPAQYYAGAWYADMDLTGQYEQVVANGGLANSVSGQYGDPTTVADDVVVDGRIITAENYDSSLYFGEVIAQQVLANLPPENQPPEAADASWGLPENSPAGTVAGVVAASDPDAGQTLTFSIVAGNTNNAFAIDPSTGVVTVANPTALDFETTPVFNLIVLVTDDGNPALDGLAEITVSLANVNESPVSKLGKDLLVYGTAASNTIYLWSGSAGRVYAWFDGGAHGPFQLPPGGQVIVFGGGGNDQIFATDLTMPAIIFGEGGHDLITGGSSHDVIDGGDGTDRIWGGPGNDLIRGGEGADYLFGREGNDVLLGGAGNDWTDGFTGRDVLIGGLGTDQMMGGDGEDLLVGGTTDFDDDDEVLAEVLATWASPDDLASRLRLLSAELRWGSTVRDDAEPDTLLGGSGADWVFKGLGEPLYAPGPDDVVTQA